MTDKYADLRLTRHKATPGPWHVDSHGMQVTSMQTLDVIFRPIADQEPVRHEETGNLSSWRNDWDASWIASADPKVVGQLLDDYDAERRRADAAVEDANEAEREIHRLRAILTKIHTQLSNMPGHDDATDLAFLQRELEEFRK